MPQPSAWQRRQGPCLAAGVLKRLLVLLALAVFSSSGLGHSAMGGKSASAAAVSHELASAGHAPTADHPCPGETDEAHGSACCVVSLCSFVLPLGSSAAMIRTIAAEVLRELPDELHHGLGTSPGLRPPSLSSNV